MLTNNFQILYIAYIPTKHMYYLYETYIQVSRKPYS